MAHQKEANVLSIMVYYSLSTLLGRQTLGEEYCDIMQVDGKRIIPPSILQRSSLVALTVLAPYLGELLSVYIERFLRPRVQTLSGKEPIKEETRKKCAAWFAKLRSFLHVVQSVHMAAFYLHGVYYHIPKRLVDIKMVRSRTPHFSPLSPDFPLLFLTFIDLLD